MEKAAIFIENVLKKIKAYGFDIVGLYVYGCSECVHE